MKRLRGTLVSRLAMAGALWGLTSGADLGAQQAIPSSKLLQSSGKVAAVDPIRNTVTVEEKVGGFSSAEQPRSFVVNPNTQITDPKKGQALRLTDLTPGASVKIEYAVENGKNLARSIVIQAAAGPAAPSSRP